MPPATRPELDGTSEAAPGALSGSRRLQSGDLIGGRRQLQIVKGPDFVVTTKRIVFKSGEILVNTVTAPLIEEREISTSARITVMAVGGVWWSMIAVVWPGRQVKVMSCSTSLSAPG